MTTSILKESQEICCAATCHDLNAAFKLLLINIKLSFIYEVVRQYWQAFGVGVVTTGGEMLGSIQSDSAMATAPVADVSVCRA
jgi:hypothetical protein